MSNQAGIAEASGTKEPRLTLVAAHCAEGISRSGAGFRVVHTMSGMELGIVANRQFYVGGRKFFSGWCYVCPLPCDYPQGLSYADHPTADAAATALSAYVLDHKLSAIRDRLALAADGAVA